MEELVADTGEHPSAARRNASPGELDKETREELVDVEGRGFGEFGEKVGGEVDGVVDVVRERDGRGVGQASLQEVAGAESRLGGTKTTTAAVGIVVRAARRGGRVRLFRGSNGKIDD